MVACGPGSGPLPTPTPGGGFYVETLFQQANGLIGIIANIQFSGEFYDDLDGAAGSPNPFTDTTGNNGLTEEPGRRAPATWTFKWLSPWPTPSCSGQSIRYAVEEVWETVGLDCQEIVISELSLNPIPIDLSSLPSTVSASGASQGAFVATYGMPQAQYIDENGTIQGVANAYSISPDGTSISADTPSIGYIPIGTYVGVAGNVQQDNSLGIVGAGSVQVQNTVYVTGSLDEEDSNGVMGVSIVNDGIEDSQNMPSVEIWDANNRVWDGPFTAGSCDSNYCYWSLQAPAGTSGMDLPIIVYNSDPTYGYVPVANGSVGVETGECVASGQPCTDNSQCCSAACEPGNGMCQ